MSSSDSKASADRIRRNDQSLTRVRIGCCTWVCKFFNTVRTPNQLNDLVESLSITLGGGLLRENLFATMATNGWSSIQELALYDAYRYMSLSDVEQ